MPPPHPRLCLRPQTQPLLSITSPPICRPPRTRLFSTHPHLLANLIKRPHRPYTFTQLLTLSDGSTFTHRTTSPVPVYKSNRDTRNTALWNPSNQKMANVEEDEAGTLRAFRRRFGRGWDVEEAERDGEKGEEGEGEVDGGGEASLGSDRDDGAWEDRGGDNLLDLISSYGQGEEKGGSAPPATGAGKRKGGQK